MKSRTPLLLVALATVLVAGSLSAAEFESIFDGKTLKGWKSPVMKYWSVQDGAITAESTPENPCKSNQFIVWQGGRAIVWLIDLRCGSFEEAQGGPGFGAVVVEAGVESREDFRVMKPQDGAP